MTTVTQLTIGAGRAYLRLACGHLAEVTLRPFPTPGAGYDCPDCLLAEFTVRELQRLQFWRFARLTERPFASEQVAR